MRLNKRRKKILELNARCEIKNARCEIKMRDKNARCEIEYCEIPGQALWSRNLTKKERQRQAARAINVFFSGGSNYSFTLTSMSFRD